MAMAVTKTRPRLAQGVALVLVGLYLVAAGHLAFLFLIGHGQDHDPERCPLCVFLHTAPILAVSAVLLMGFTRPAFHARVLSEPIHRDLHQSPSSPRAPPLRFS